MILKSLLILVLINETKCNIYTKKNYSLNIALEYTSNFFEKLKSDYAFKKINKDTLTKINQIVMEYPNSALKTISSRHKRKLYEVSNKGINILNGFKEFNKLNFDGIEDINFFSLQHGFETIWFAAVLDTSKVSLYQINNEVFYAVGAYPLINGTQVIVNSCIYGAILIIQNQNQSLLILSFTKVLNNYYLQPIQDFELNDMTYLMIWNGINQLHLGIATHSNISIFTWFGNYFDLIQIINIGTKKLIPFQSKGFMYLAVTGSTTFIFKYFLKSNEFLITQRLSTSQDVSFFQLKEGHFMEHFLSLSTKSSTIIYKEIHDRFVPFQQIPFGEFTAPIILHKAIVLLTLYKDTIVSYQYDGWRFIKLNIKLSGISHFHEAILDGKNLLVIKNKYDKWNLKQPIWIKKKSYKDLQEKITIWTIDAKNAIQRIVGKSLNKKNPVKILKSSIGQLNIYNINGHDSQNLKNVSKHYKRIASKFEKQKLLMNNKQNIKNFYLVSLDAKRVQLKCKIKCKINRLNVNGNNNFSFKLTVPNDINELGFKKLSIKKIKNWKCPLLSFPIQDITISKLINGISLNYLQKNALKVIGDQKVFGKHIFANINATNAFMPLNIAMNLTNQDVIMKQMKIKQLNLTVGGILLPLNGPPTTIAGLVKTLKLKVRGSILLQGKLSPDGEGTKRLSPVIYIFEPMILNDDFDMENVKIEKLRSTNLITNKVGSVKIILSEAISLHENMPTSLIFSNKRLRWNNLHYPQNWITMNSQNSTVILGKKQFSYDVEITEFSYDSLKFPQIQAKLCINSIIAPNIKTSALVANNITVKSLICSQVFGNLNEKYLIDNSMVLFNPVLSGEQYYHRIIATNTFATQLNNLNLIELKKLLNLWVESNIFNISIEATKLKTNILVSPIQFNIKLPKMMKNIRLKQNVYIDDINNINFIDLLANTIKLENMISLQNVTFHNAFTTKHTYASFIPFYLTDIKRNFHFNKKGISKNIEVNTINLPYVFKITQNKTSINIIIKGFANFLIEPKIITINNNKLKKLVTKIWLARNATMFYGNNLHIEDVAIQGSIILNNSIKILNPETWKNISKHILRKTKLQEVAVHVFLNDVKISTIMGSNFSTIRSSLSDFTNVLEYSLVKNKDQGVKTKWTFNTLKVLGNLQLKNKINNMDLKKNLIRYDSKENTVTGKKTVVVLTTKNLNGYSFDKWIDNTLMQKKKYIIIRGRKKFNTVTFSNIKVFGTIMGYTMEEILSKSKNQTFYGQKKIQGSVNTSELIINGLVNDVNFTKLVDHQLKKYKSLQKIKTRIEFQNNLNIVGNLIIKDTYAGVKMKMFHKSYPNISSITKKMKKSAKTTETLNTALQNRAIYINKLEVIKGTINAFNKSVTVKTLECKSTNISSPCTNEPIINFGLQINTIDFISIKSITLNKEKFIVLIKFDSVSIYLFNNTENILVHMKDLHITKIMNAFVEPRLHSFWIVLQLNSQTLVLQYQPWKDLQEYILPATDVFSINKSPNDQLLLLLSDGIWNLEGLASPRNIIKISFKQKVETFIDGFNYYVKCTSKNDTTVIKARYVGT